MQLSNLPSLDSKMIEEEARGLIEDTEPDRFYGKMLVILFKKKN